MEKAARDNKPDTVCTQIFTEHRLAALKAQGTNCNTGVKEAFKDADSFDLTVDDVTISGDAARVKVTSGTGSDKKTDTLELKREGATWKVDSLASSPSAGVNGTRSRARRSARQQPEHDDERLALG